MAKKIAENVQCIVCDDAREEVGKKLTLVGIYSEKIIFAVFPALIPQLTIVFFIEGLRRDISEIRMKIDINGKKVTTIEGRVSKTKDRINKLVFRLIPFAPKEVGVMRIRLYANDSKRSFYRKTMTLESA